MKPLFSHTRLAAVCLALSVSVGFAHAGSCGPAGCGVGGVGISDYGYEGVGFNRAWVYPDGGFTVYPGQPGSCVPSHSDYSKVNWTAPPTVNAQRVLDKLRTLGIPQVSPDTIYLGKNPRAAENVLMPTPKGWAPKEEEPKEADPKGKANEKSDKTDKPDLVDKPKQDEKPKVVDQPKSVEKPKAKNAELPKVEPKDATKDKSDKQKLDDDL